MKNRFRLYTIVLLLVPLLTLCVIWGCKRTADERPTPYLKMDAPLRMKLAEMERTEDRAPVQCLIEIDGELDTETKEKLERTGIRVITVVGTIAAIEGDPDSIVRCAGLDIVRSVSLSIVRQPFE
jgi:hypothetical protein